MLTDYRPFNKDTDYQLGHGYKAFPFGIDPSLRGRWLQSKQGPGFHVFHELDAAKRYVAGLEQGVVEQVLFKEIKLVGHEGNDPAVTVEWLYIPPVITSVAVKYDALSKIFRFVTPIDHHVFLDGETYEVRNVSGS